LLDVKRAQSTEPERTRPESRQLDTTRPQAETPRLRSRQSPQPSVDERLLNEVGENGMLRHRLAEAALERRGNAAIRRSLADAARIYDRKAQRSWDQKYKFFSSAHMQDQFKVFARARHDPFNKDPCWSQSIISQVSQTCVIKGVEPEEMLRSTQAASDHLDRAEMKRVLCSVVPNMSDIEITAIFDFLDTEHSGEVNAKEFCKAIRQGKISGPVSQKKADRWRNPVFRVNRMSPARIEGWDHLEGEPCVAPIEKVCESETRELMARLGGELISRLQTVKHDSTPKYRYFAGGVGIGASTDRFRKEAWRQVREKTPEVPLLPIPDPGFDVKPGWLCDTEGQLTVRSLATPRSTKKTPRTRKGDT